MRRGPSPWWDSVPLCFLLLGGAVFSVFGLAFWAPFIYDDVVFLLNYPEVTGPWGGVKHWLLTPLLSSGEYEPLPTLFNRLIFTLFGIQTWPYRLGSLALHWLNACLFYLLGRRLLAASAPALLAALVFALYPGHVELMAIATFKKHLLVFFFAMVLLALQSRRSLPEPARLAGCWTALTLALLCKESALLLPAIALLFGPLTEDKNSRGPRRDVVLYGGMAVLCLAFIFFRSWVLPRQIPPLQTGLGAHLLTSGKCLLWYLAQLVLPVSLCQEHSFSPVPAVLSPQGLLVAGGLTLAGAGACWLWRSERLAGAAAAWICLSLAPFINLLPFANFSLIANRYLYMASAAFALVLGSLFRRLPAARLGGLSPAAWLCVVLALIYSSTAMTALARYSDPIELWSHTVGCAPLNPRGYIGLGSALRAKGRLPEAEKALRRSIELAPDYYAAWGRLQLAEVLAGTGRQDEALALAQGQLAHEPWAARGIIGALLMNRGKFSEALPFLEVAHRMWPESGETAIILGRCYLELNELDQAERVWTAALSRPTQRLEALHWLEALALKRGRPGKASAKD